MVNHILYWFSIYLSVCSHIINFPSQDLNLEFAKWMNWFISRELCLSIPDIIVVQNAKKNLKIAVKLHTGNTKNVDALIVYT